MNSRKFVFGSILGAAILVASAAVGFAQCTVKPAQKSAKESKQKLTCVVGTVKSLDVKKRDLVVTTGKDKQAKTVALKVCPKATIQIDGKKADLAAVKTGVPVRLCAITTDKGVRVAVVVTIGKGKCPHIAACCPDNCPHKGNCTDGCRQHKGKCRHKGNGHHEGGCKDGCPHKGACKDDCSNKDACPNKDACKDGCKDGCPH